MKFEDFYKVNCLSDHLRKVTELSDQMFERKALTIRPSGMDHRDETYIADAEFISGFSAFLADHKAATIKRLEALGVEMPKETST